MNEVEVLQEAFKLVCKKCGSENVVIDITRGRHYDSCYIEGGITFGCNDCKQNDVVIDI